MRLTSRSAFLTTLLVLVLGAVTAAWIMKPWRPRRPRFEAPPSILFLLLDTVRADHVSCYGYQRPTTPRIDALAAHGTRFAQAQAMAPWTIPSVASLWTGVQPSVHSAGIPARIKRFQDETSFRGFKQDALATLPMRLAQQGYRNYAVIANPLLTNECYTSGFVKDRCVVERKSAEAVVDQALSWLPELEGGAPFFLYVHFMDAHQPIEPPPRYRDLFPTDGEDRGRLAGAPEQQTHGRFAEWGGYYLPERMHGAKFDAFRASKVAVYDGALRYMDDQIGRLLDALQSRHLLDRTIVVVTADHGEEMWDHVRLQTELYDVKLRPHVGIGHGHTQFQELLSVPLVVAGPQLPVAVVAPRVSLPDIGATLLDLATGDADVRFGLSSSLVELMIGADRAGRTVVSEETSFGYEVKALVDERGMKLIAAIDPSEHDALFDLNADPGETRNLLASQPAAADRLRGMLRARLDRARQLRLDPGAFSSVPKSELNKLGYIGAGRDKSQGDGDAKPLDKPADSAPDKH
ncbi:MAG: sulfatase [Planctomycetota bacterium]